MEGTSLEMVKILDLLGRIPKYHAAKVPVSGQTKHDVACELNFVFFVAFFFADYPC
jgi:hypothetical protein